MQAISPLTFRNFVLVANAKSVIAIVRPLSASSHIQQFAGWENYAVNRTAEDRTRWLLQCRTPFLALPPAMQKSDYVTLWPQYGPIRA